MANPIESEDDFMQRYREAASSGNFPQTSVASNQAESTPSPSTQESKDSEGVGGFLNNLYKGTIGKIATGIGDVTGINYLAKQQEKEGGLSGAIGMSQPELNDTELRAMQKRMANAPVNFLGGLASMAHGVLGIAADPVSAAKGISKLSQGFWENQKNELGIGDGQETPEIQAFKEFSDKHMAGLGKSLTWDDFKQHLSDMAQRDPFEFAAAVTPVAGVGAGIVSKLGGRTLSSLGEDLTRAAVLSENAGSARIASGLEKAGSAAQTVGGGLESLAPKLAQGGIQAGTEAVQTAAELPGNIIRGAGNLAEKIIGPGRISGGLQDLGTMIAANPLTAPARIGIGAAGRAVSAPFRMGQWALGKTSGLGSEALAEFSRGPSSELSLGRTEGGDFARGEGTGIETLKSQASELGEAVKQKTGEMYQGIKNDPTPVLPEAADELLSNVQSNLEKTGYSLGEKGGVMDTGRFATNETAVAKLGGMKKAQDIANAVEGFRQAVIQENATVGSVTEAYQALKAKLPIESYPEASPVMGAIKNAVQNATGGLEKIGAADREFGAIQSVLKETGYLGKDSISASSDAINFLKNLSSDTAGISKLASDTARAFMDAYKRYTGKEGFNFEEYARGLQASKWTRSRVFAQSAAGTAGTLSYAMHSIPTALIGLSVLAASSPRFVSYIAQILGIPGRIVRSVSETLGRSAKSVMDTPVAEQVAAQMQDTSKNQKEVVQEITPVVEPVKKTGSVRSETPEQESIPKTASEKKKIQEEKAKVEQDIQVARQKLKSEQERKDLAKQNQLSTLKEKAAKRFARENPVKIEEVGSGELPEPIKMEKSEPGVAEEVNLNKMGGGKTETPAPKKSISRPAAEKMSREELETQISLKEKAIKSGKYDMPARRAMESSLASLKKQLKSLK